MTDTATPEITPTTDTPDTAPAEDQTPTPESTPEPQTPEQDTAQDASPAQEPTDAPDMAEEDEDDESALFQISGLSKKGRQPHQGRNWYAIHTYSGYEKAVQKALEQRIDTLNMQDKIFRVLVPEDTQIAIRRGKPVEVKKCLFPGYVLVEMEVTDDSWYVVRNTPNVTGFVGSGTIPVPVAPEEFGIIEKRMGTEKAEFKSDFNLGDVVKIMKGPFATFEGKVDSINTTKGNLTVLVTVFDRETPVELDFDQVVKK